MLYDEIIHCSRIIFQILIWMIHTNFSGSLSQTLMHILSDNFLAFNNNDIIKCYMMK